MMINGTGATSINDVNAMTTLTPDDMMAYCSARLGGIDDEIKTQFDRQNQYKGASNALNTLHSLASNASATANGVVDDASKGTGNAAAYLAQMDDAFKTAIATLPQDSPELATVKEQYANFQSQQQSGGSLDKGECQKLADAVHDIQTTIGSSAELDMINLNSLMSQRQTAVQMVSGMVSSQGETMKQLASKIGS